MHTTNYPNGITTTEKISNLGQFILPDPSKAHVFFDDFENFTEALWHVEKDTTGDVDHLTTGVANGVIQLETITTADGVLVQSIVDNILFVDQTSAVPGPPISFKTRMSLTDVDTTLRWLTGIYNNTTDIVPVTLQPGAYFQGVGTTLSFMVLDGSGGVIEVPLSLSIPSDEYFTLGFVFDGLGVYRLFFNDVMFDSIIHPEAFTDITLSPTVAISEPTGSAQQTIEVDYIFAAKERI